MWSLLPVQEYHFFPSNTSYYSVNLQLALGNVGASLADARPIMPQEARQSTMIERQKSRRPAKAPAFLSLDHTSGSSRPRGLCANDMVVRICIRTKQRMRNKPLLAIKW
jgi:hypothetical protein